MDLLETLKSEGWFLTEEGIKKIPENIDKSDLQNVRKWALDMDFREIAGGALAQDISKKDESIKGKIVLQISKIRNLSAPKANEESYAGAPKFLQIELTDGVNQIIGLEMENLPDVSLSTPPGTKIYLQMEKIPLMQGWLMLSYQNMRVIGGKVPALIEKWELNRALQKCAKSGRMNTGSSGPPPWIPFGQKIQTNISDDKNFKSLNASKDKENKTNNEFDAMRSEAIAEAAKTGKRKVFGGGQQQMVDHNVKKIMEKGYSEDQAKYALKTTRNNLERALFNLKRRDEYKNKEEFIDKTRGAKRIGKDNKKAKSEEVVASKPAGNVSLFDYLTDKLPVTETTNDKPVASSKNERPPQKYNNYNDTPKSQNAPSQRSQSQPQSFQQNIASNNTNNASRPKFENNISSSFANRNTNNGPSDQPYGGSERHRDYNANRNRPPRDGPGQYNNSSNQYGSSQRDSGDKYRGNTRNVKDRNQRMPERNSNYQNQSNYHSSNNYESQPRYNRNNSNNNNNSQRKNYESSGGSNSGPNRYQQREGNNMNNQSQSSKPYHENRPNSYGGNNEKINKLSESTAKMRIENAKTPPSGRNSHIASIAISGGNQQQSHSHHQSHQQQHQGQHQQHQPQAQQILQPPQTGLMQNNYNPLPNGFAYDPSKIMGFRSKEANEFAMSVLKNQSPAQIPPTVVPQQAHYPPPLQIPQQAYPPPAQFLMQPQHAQPPPPPAFAVNQFGDWVWKIGDRCLAKYWDDGRFYEAEITNLSENTCVVLFIEYGNHEEVLKTDCIPITDSQHRTINYSKMNEINNPHHHQTVRGVGGRYRGERQVYVPPPKREA